MKPRVFKRDGFWHVDRGPRYFTAFFVSWQFAIDDALYCKWWRSLRLPESE